MGMSRGVKKLIKTKLPDLGKYEDISEYIDKLVFVYFILII